MIRKNLVDTDFHRFLAPAVLAQSGSDLAGGAVVFHPSGRMDLELDGRVIAGDLSGAMLVDACNRAMTSLWSQQHKDCLLDAAVVALDDQAALILGEDAATRCALVAKLVEQGFRYCGLSRAALGADGTVSAHCGAFEIPEAALACVMRHDRFRDLLSLRGEGKVFTQLPEPALSGGRLQLAAVLVAENGLAAQQTSLALLDAQAAQQQLTRQRLSSDPAAADLAESAFEPEIPCMTIRVGRQAEPRLALACLLRQILEEGWDADSAAGFVSGFSRPATAAPAAVPGKAPPATAAAGRQFKLTIGMATYDDYDGVYFTIQALRLQNPGLLDDVEFLVLDNNPTGLCAGPLKVLENHIPTYRYVPYMAHASTAVRDVLFREAAGKFVLCMDCHVLLENGVLGKILALIDAEPDSPHFYQGPLIYDNLRDCSTHFQMGDWKNGMHGTWAHDPRGSDPEAPAFDIPMQGLGLFLCRKDAWPGINPRFRGFGGEEGYVQEKVRQNGGRTLCLPFLRWLHRFNRPLGVPYRNAWEDRIRNYIIGHREVGWDLEPVKAHFTTILGAGPLEAIWHTNLSGGVPGDGDQTRKAFAQLGIGKLASWFPVSKLAEDGKTVSARHWLELLEFSQQCRFESVLLLDENVAFAPEALTRIADTLDRAREQDWQAIVLHDAESGDPAGLRRSAITADVPALALHHSAYAAAIAALKAALDDPSPQPASLGSILSRGSLTVFAPAQPVLSAAPAPADLTLPMSQKPAAPAGQAAP